jgi:hypothetical protein
LKRRGIAAAIHILSGIPFSILKIDKKARFSKTHDALAPGGSFIIYQVTNELKQHATLFEMRRIRMLPAKHTTDVHYRFHKAESAESLNGWNARATHAHGR